MIIIKKKNGDKIIELTEANLTEADLTEANLLYTNLTGADLRGADLTRADLLYTNLREIKINQCAGNLAEIKSIHIETWIVSFTAKEMAIGCQQYPIEKWRNFSDQEISEMNTEALTWWKKWKGFIFSAIELSFGVE